MANDESNCRMYEQIISEIGNADYNILASSLEYLADALKSRGLKESEKGKADLSREVLGASTYVRIAGTRINLAEKLTNNP